MGWGGVRSEGEPVGRARVADRAPGAPRPHPRGVDDIAAHRCARAPTGRAIRPARLAGVFAALLVAWAPLACGSDASGADDADDIGLEARSEAAEPDATDVEAVRPYLDALLERHAAVVEAVSTDPTQVADADAPLATEYLGLFEPGSDAAAAIVDGWVATAGEGVTMAPYEEGSPIFTLRVSGGITATSDDAVTFAVCAEERSLTYEDGRLVRTTPYTTQPGRAEAVRADGRWLLRSVDLTPDRTACEDEGG